MGRLISINSIILSMSISNPRFTIEKKIEVWRPPKQERGETGMVSPLLLCGIVKAAYFVQTGLVS